MRRLILRNVSIRAGLVFETVKYLIHEAAGVVVFRSALVSLGSVIVNQQRFIMVSLRHIIELMLIDYFFNRFLCLLQLTTIYYIHISDVQIVRKQLIFILIVFVFQQLLHLLYLLLRVNYKNGPFFIFVMLSNQRYFGSLHNFDGIYFLIFLQQRLRLLAVMDWWMFHVFF